LHIDAQAMNTMITKDSLTPARRRLVDLMQATWYGRIEHLIVHGREPLLDPPPKIVRVLKTNGENSVDTELNGCDFALRREVLQLLKYLDEIGDGMIETVEIRRGLPCEIILEGRVA
jgi:hypothetical protein